jgi:hypothetical protein
MYNLYLDLSYRNVLIGEIIWQMYCVILHLQGQIRDIFNINILNNWI